MTAFNFDATREELAQLLGEVRRKTEGGWVAVSVSAPGGGARKLLDAELTDESVYYSAGDSIRGGDQETFVGVGSLASRRFEGAQRFANAEAFIAETFARGRVPTAHESDVRFFGGAAFSPGRDGSGSCWADFGDARFVLPRCIYVDGDAPRLIVLSETETQESEQLANRVLDCLATRDSAHTSNVQEISRVDSEEPSSWREMIEAIKAEIDGGAVEKIVAARRVTLELSEAPRLSHLVARFNSQAPECARFALRVGRKTFVGATPERLVRKTGKWIETEALAGSIAADLEGGAALLLQSDKNRREHAHVVSAVETALRKRCASLELPDVPEVRRLRSILHLRTPIKGTLAGPVNVLRLVDDLHPTPAVGGLPSEPAVNFISQHERAERGWYAAPVGWVNCRGDGEFVVALRSGLIARNKVHLYAGAGIVAGSDSDEEYAETELKLGGMLGALGLEPQPARDGARLGERTAS